MVYYLRCTECPYPRIRSAAYFDVKVATVLRNAHRAKTDHLVLIEYRDPENSETVRTFNPDATGATLGGAP